MNVDACSTFDIGTMFNFMKCSPACCSDFPFSLLHSWIASSCHSLVGHFPECDSPSPVLADCDDVHFLHYWLLLVWV